MRLYNLVILMLLVFMFGSCESSENGSVCGEDDYIISGICYDRTAPEFIGLNDLELFVGSSFNPLSGITAIDARDGDLTKFITYHGDVDVNSVGTYFLKYSVEDQTGNIKEAVRYVIIKYDISNLSNLLVNGDFTYGLDNWIIYSVSNGGSGEFSVDNGELKVNIVSINSGIYWEPRIHSEGITLENSKTYQVSFEAKSVLPRSIHILMGELYNTEPWFLGFLSMGKIYNLNSEYQTISFEFTMYNETNYNGSILFEFGDVLGNIGQDSLLTIVYIDNVSIKEIE